MVVVIVKTAKQFVGAQPLASRRTNHLTAAEFWQQAFAYLETYSCNRGPASPELAAQLHQELAATQQARQAARYLQQARLDRQLRELQQALRGSQHNQRLFELGPHEEYTRQKIATLLPGATATRQLGRLLSQTTAQEFLAGCLPIYRDALVFYNAPGQRTAVLTSCFECQLMATADNQIVETDCATYDALRALLRELGHPIEPAGY